MCERVVEGTKLVSCVETMVRIEINLTGLRQLVACVRFPNDYPDLPVLLELKSRTLSDGLLEKLKEITEAEAKKFCGRPQVLQVIRFLRQFLSENSLCVVFDEILDIKKILTDADSLKLKQKNSKVILKITEGRYFFNGIFSVPAEYFKKPVSVVDYQTNLPRVLENFLIGQAQVIAKQCTEPSATRFVKFKDGKERIIGGKTVRPVTGSTSAFVACPSLKRIAVFWVNSVRQLVKEQCQLCAKQCLPYDPTLVQRDESADDHVERVYCGHLFHLSCLLTFMKTPPFKGGKKCAACGEVIAHDKWRLSERTAENRWAHEQARARELEEVAEFFD